MSRPPLVERHQSGFNGGERQRLLVCSRACAANGPEVVRGGWTDGWIWLLPRFPSFALDSMCPEGVVEIRRHGGGDGGFSGGRVDGWRPNDPCAPLARAVMGRVSLGKWPCICDARAVTRRSVERGVLPGEIGYSHCRSRSVQEIGVRGRHTSLLNR